MPERIVRLADLGEAELIRRLARFAAPGRFDDDAALLPPAAADDRLVVNTDVLVEGVHFSEATTSAEDVGWRAAAANLSDLAAMGCRQVVGLTVGLVAPGSTAWAWVEGVYRGIGAVLARHGGELLGGDCSSGAERLLAITALGRVAAAGGPIRRGDARPGDLLISSGPHGLSRLGLAQLLAPGGASPPPDELAALGPDLRARAVRAHRRPSPRLDVIAALLETRPVGCPWRVGGCDSSDGLVAALNALALASGTTAVLERGALPLDPAMAPLPQALAWCLGGGEDFELVLALPEAWGRELVARSAGASVIGRMEPRQGGQTLRWSDGAPLAEAPALGYQHYG